MLTEYWYPWETEVFLRETGVGKDAVSPGKGPRRRRSFKRPPINWITAQVLAMSVFTIVVVAYVARDSEQQLTARLTSPAASTPTVAAPGRPAEPVVERPPAAAPVPPASVFAVDDRGFLNWQARCGAEASAVAMGRTTRSLVVVCKLPDGSYEYDGVRISDGAALRLNNVRATPDGFVARSDGVTYTVSPLELLVAEGNEILSRDAMLDYRALPS